MRGSRWNGIAAVTVFLLIAAVVVAGMGWATSSSFQLARKNVTEERRTQMQQARLEITSYMAGILNSEASRDYTDYKAVHARRPLLIYSMGDVQLNAQFADFLSPLAISGPPQAWMDLNFHIGTDGMLSSPQFPDHTSVISAEAQRLMATPSADSQRVWEWLRTALPEAGLHERVAQACGSENRAAAAGRPRQTSDSLAGNVTERVANSLTVSQSDKPFEQRKRELRDAQLSYLPVPACEDPRIAEHNVRNSSTAISSGPLNAASSALGEVEITLDPFTAAFWLEGGPSGAQKLVFVREVHSDASAFYQGFIGDWARLKPELLRRVQEPIAGMDLEPVLDATSSALTTTSAHIPNLPVRITAPDIPGGATAAAWREVRGTLTTMWIATAAVLLVAGLGLRNLVALTERRMQFAYAVTHELRTPLTTFRLYSDMLSAGMVPEESKQEYLDTLNRESLRLSSLVEGVLEYSRLENQKVKLSLTLTDGPSLLSSIAENLKMQCEAKGIQVKTENELTNGLLLRTDVDVVTRIAGVLVNNACRHARGSENASVLVHLGSDNGSVFLDVADSGGGIERRDVRAIFRPFRRGRKADAAAQGGIGLGLALARNWAGLLGGKLVLADRHHPKLGGAHFRLTFPANFSS